MSLSVLHYGRQPGTCFTVQMQAPLTSEGKDEDIVHDRAFGEDSPQTIKHESAEKGQADDEIEEEGRCVYRILDSTVS